MDLIEISKSSYFKRLAASGKQPVDAFVAARLEAHKKGRTAAKHEALGRKSEKARQEAIAESDKHPPLSLPRREQDSLARIHEKALVGHGQKKRNAMHQGYIARQDANAEAERRLADLKPSTFMADTRPRPTHAPKPSSRPGWSAVHNKSKSQPKAASGGSASTSQAPSPDTSGAGSSHRGAAVAAGAGLTAIAGLAGRRAMKDRKTLKGIEAARAKRRKDVALAAGVGGSTLTAAGLLRYKGRERDRGSD